MDTEPSSGHDWYNFALYTDPYIRRLHTEIDQVVKSVAKTTYSPSDFTHFDVMHYCGHKYLSAFVDQEFGRKGGIRALEIGSGAGASARMLAERYGVRVTGLDYTEGLNEVHRRINALCGIKTIEAIRADATTYDLSQLKGNYDFVYSILALLHIDKRPAVYRLANQALRLRGLFYFEDFTMQNPEQESQEELEACSLLRFCSKVSTAANCELLEAAGFQVESYINRTREWSEFVWARAEESLSLRSSIISLHGPEVFSSFYLSQAVQNVPKFYHDLGLNLEEVRNRYPHMWEEMGEDWMRKWTQEVSQKYGGSHVVVRKIREVE